MGNVRRQSVLTQSPLRHFQRNPVTLYTCENTLGYIIRIGLACSPHPPRASPFSLRWGLGFGCRHSIREG